MGVRKLEQDEHDQQRIRHILPHGDGNIALSHEHLEELRSQLYTVQGKRRLAVYYKHLACIKTKFSIDPAYLNHFTLCRIARQFHWISHALFSI
jgi:hypothetical protein